MEQAGTGHWEEVEEANTRASGGLTHGPSVDGLRFVFVLGPVPHKGQPFESCGQFRGPVRAGERQKSPPGGGRWRTRKKEGRTDGC